MEKPSSEKKFEQRPIILADGRRLIYYDFPKVKLDAAKIVSPQPQNGKEH